MTKFEIDNLTYDIINILATDGFLPLQKGQREKDGTYKHKSSMLKYKTKEDKAKLPKTMQEALLFSETNHNCTGLAFLLNNVILFDVDDKLQGEIVFNILKNDASNLNFIYSKTDKGYHFYFKNSNFNAYSKNQQKVYCAIGIPADIKGFSNSYSAFVVNYKPRQYFIHGEVNSCDELSPLPFYLTSINVFDNKDKVEDMTPMQQTLKTLYRCVDGARNNPLYVLSNHLVRQGFSKQHLTIILDIINNYIIKDKCSDDEILSFIKRYDEFKENIEEYQKENNKKIKYVIPEELEFKNKFEKLIHHIEMLGIAKYDTFTRDIYFNDEILSDFVITKIMKDLSINATFENVQKALIYLANHNTYDSMQEHLNNLPNWDEVNRCEEFFINYCGAENTKANRIAGLYFWSSLYNRAYNVNGCKADTSIVLKGIQGLRKSTLIKRICWDNYASDRFNFLTTQNERTRRLKGYVIVEIGELKGMKNADVRELKDYLSLQVDDYRPNYSNYVQNLPRRNIFVLTTNEDEFLKDTTGNRRYAVVNCGIAPNGMTKTKKGYKINIEALTDEIINQLWAEAKTIPLTRELADEIEEAFKDINAHNLVMPKYHDDVLNAIEKVGKLNDKNAFLLSDLLEKMNLTLREKTEVIKSLKILGYESKPIKIQSKTQRIYIKE